MVRFGQITVLSFILSIGISNPVNSSLLCRVVFAVVCESTLVKRLYSSRVNRITHVYNGVLLAVKSRRSHPLKRTVFQVKQDWFDFFLNDSYLIKGVRESISLVLKLTIRLWDVLFGLLQLNR